MLYLETMTKNLPSIYFYCPQSNEEMIKSLPEKAEEFWQWRIHQSSKYQVSGNTCSWTLQTYLYLKESGLPCQLTNTIPDESIIFASRDNLPFTLKPSAKTLIVCLLGDQATHPYAQINVVHNPQGLYIKLALLGDFTAPRVISTQSNPIKDTYFMRHWPQPQIIPRSQQRGTNFKNIAYMGVGYSLAKEMLGNSWKDRIEILGLHWYFKNQESWHDYSDVDAIVAVRRAYQETDYPWKPASKLYNAWHGGVIPILGLESAYRAERRSKLDYIEVHSPAEVITALERLRDDISLRQAIIENGRQRAKEITSDKLVNQWQNFIIDILVPAYENWYKKSIWSQQLFLKRRQFAVTKNAVQRYLEFKVEGVQRRLNLN